MVFSLVKRNLPYGNSYPNRKVTEHKTKSSNQGKSQFNDHRWGDLKEVRNKKKIETFPRLSLLLTWTAANTKTISNSVAILSVHIISLGPSKVVDNRTPRARATRRSQFRQDRPLPPRTHIQISGSTSTEDVGSIKNIDIICDACYVNRDMGALIMKRCANPLLPSK